MSTAVWSIQGAVDTAIKADGTLAGKLVGLKTYNEGKIPDNLTLTDGTKGIIAYGTNAESEFNRFNHAGNDGDAVLHIWSPLKSTVLSIYDDINRLFHRKPLTVTGHGVLLVKVRLSLVTPDPKGPVHGVVFVSTITGVGA